MKKEQKKFNLSDRPGFSQDEDFFDVENRFVKKIYNLIQDNSICPLTIAITGEWGIGKTTVINRLYDKIKKDNKIILVDFEPLLEGKLEIHEILELFYLKIYQKATDNSIKDEIKKCLKSILIFSRLKIAGNISIPSILGLPSGSACLEYDWGKNIDDFLKEIVTSENLINVSLLYEGHLEINIFMNVLSNVIHRLENVHLEIKKILKENFEVYTKVIPRLEWIDFVLEQKTLKKTASNKKNIDDIKKNLKNVKDAVVLILNDEKWHIESHGILKIDIAIIGAGLAGVALSIFLQMKGFSVHVFELLENPVANLLHSFNITLCERGLYAMAAIGLREKIEQKCVKVYGREIHKKDGSRYDFLYGQNESDALFSIKRQELLRLLLLQAKKLGVIFHFGTECGRYNFDTVEFKAFNHIEKYSISVTAKNIFGADGVHSTLRQHFENIHGFSLIEKYKLKSNILYTELHNIPYQGRLDRLHVWPRGDQGTLIAFPNKNNQFTFSLFINEENHPPHQDFFQVNFSEIFHYIPTFFFSQQYKNLYEVRFFPWAYQGKVFLFGDSAHAFYPFYGQAANSIFESCRELSELIEESETMQWYDIFMKFQYTRKININYIATLAAKHANVLFEEISDEKEYIINTAIGKQITRLYPYLIPLYNLISFTLIDYQKAVLIGSQFEQVLSDVRTHVSANPEIKKSEMEKIIHESVKKKIYNIKRTNQGIHVGLFKPMKQPTLKKTAEREIKLTAKL